MHFCRFCGSERLTASRVRCEGCGGKEWRWKDDPAAVLPDPSPEPKAEPQTKPDFGFKQDEPPTLSEEDGSPNIAESIGNFVAGCGWTVVLALVVFLVYCAVRGTLESNRVMRSGRFEHGYETQEDIKDYPEEYARALRVRLEAREQQAARKAKSKADQEATERDQQRENSRAEGEDPENSSKDNAPRHQEPE